MSEAKRLLSDLELRIREAINNAADGLNDATRWDQSDEADSDGKTPMDKLVRRISEMQSEITAVILIKADLYDHALDCVDLVFQKCSKNPNPILPDFCMVGESKFRAVVRLAKQHVKLLNELRVVLAELCGVRGHVETILVDSAAAAKVECQRLRTRLDAQSELLRSASVYVPLDSRLFESIIDAVTDQQDSTP